MIEKLKENCGCVEPQMPVIELILQKKAEGRRLKVAEVGIGYGATAVEIIKCLEENDSYYFFDFEDNVKELHKDLKDINVNNVKLFPIGNSTRTYDSYAWNIAKLMKDWKNDGTAKQFDVVYLDAAHTFLFDASAASVLKEMIVPGGYIVLDDINWTIAKSPTCSPTVNPAYAALFTEEQINCAQVGMIKECLFDTDKRYARIDDSHRIAIYKNIENA